MLLFFCRRLIQSLTILFVLSIVIYYSLGLMPGDPVELLITSNPDVTAEDVESLKKFYGLDQPIYVRYFIWLKQASKGDLGFSRVYKKPTTQLIAGRMANTFKLMLGAMLLSLLIAIPLGIYTAFRQYSHFDYLMSVMAFIGISIPSFWLGLMLITLFAETIPILPAGGMQTIGVDHFSDRLRYLILPVCSISAQSIGLWMRYMRSSILEVIKKDYIRTARAKGLDDEVILFKHALRNALIPMITVFALSLPSLVSGAVITETIFSWPGMGRLLFESVIHTDYYVAMVALLALAALTLAANLVADLLYAIVDPRIRMADKQ